MAALRHAVGELAALIKSFERGFIMFPGLCNGTAANQVADDLFGTYKTSSNAVMDNIVAEKIVANQADPSVKVATRPRPHCTHVWKATDQPVPSPCTTNRPPTLCLQIKLDFCDLGRSIAGRPEDPLQLRPFEFAFSPEKIRNSVAKLGMNPVSLKTALQHKRVRDDSSDGDRAKAEENIRARHAQRLESLKQLGLQTSVLQVAEPVVAALAPKRLVASPSKAEQDYKALEAAGTCPGAIFHSVGALPFNCPERDHLSGHGEGVGEEGDRRCREQQGDRRVHAPPHQGRGAAGGNEGGPAGLRRPDAGGSPYLGLLCVQGPRHRWRWEVCGQGRLDRFP